MLLFRCVFFALSRAALRSLKKRRSSSSLLARWRRGDADPAESAGCGTPGHLRPELAPSARHRGGPGSASRPRPAGQADEGRSGHRLRSTCPAKPLYGEDRNVTFARGLSKQHLPCLLLPLASAAAALTPRDKPGRGVVWEEGGRTARYPSPTRSFSLSVQGK